MMLWENDPLQSIYKSAQQTKKCREITSPQIGAIFSEVSHSEWSEPFDFPSLIFGFACKYPWFVCCLSVFCVVRSSYTFNVAIIITLFFCLFFNWWSVCNFTEYVRRLDEILAQKIEKFTQLRGKTALLTFFQFILVSLLLRKTQSFMLLGRSQGAILSPVNEALISGRHFSPRGWGVLVG